MTFAEVAERCEAAAGPSRHIDTQIFILLEPDAQHIVGEKPGNWPRDAIYGPRSTYWEWALDETTEPPRFAAVPAYTASLDAAMTLVPEGRSFWLNADIERFNEHETAMDGDWSIAGLYLEGSKRWQDDGRFARTPALALCAAALRAVASVDTLPKGQDAKLGLAGTEGSAVGDSRDAQP